MKSDNRDLRKNINSLSRFETDLFSRKSQFFRKRDYVISIIIKLI